MKDQPVGLLGQVVANKKLVIKGFDDSVVVDAGLKELKSAWQDTLKFS